MAKKDDKKKKKNQTISTSKNSRVVANSTVTRKKTTTTKKTRQSSAYTTPISEYRKRTNTTAKKSATTQKPSTNAKKTAQKQVAISKNSRVQDIAPVKRQTAEYSAVNNRTVSAKKLTPSQTTSRVNSVMSNSKNSRVQDIAPVKQKKQDDDRTWFKQSKEFEDGYQFGDVSKAILGSATDVVENLGAGIIGMGEKILDASAYLAPGAYLSSPANYNSVPDMKLYDEMKTEMDKFIQQDLYDEQKVARNILKGAGVDVAKQEANSVFGEKSDALIQSAGQLGATVGLQAVGVPWFVTTGMTSFGAETENALKQGATHEEAGFSGLISAGAEILSEKLSGGISFGGKTMDDVLVKNLTTRISDKTIRSLTKAGIDAVGEGSEEVVSSVFSRLGSALYKEESIGELLASEEAMDEYIESFIGGAVLGGGSSAINAVKSNKEWKDFATGLTNNELKVAQKVIENRIADEEAGGTKLSTKEKNKITQDVYRDLEKGYIDIDTIESTLGGETYKKYKDSVDNETKLQQEYDELHKMQRGNMTGEQLDRETELKNKLDELKKNSNTSQMREQLDNEMLSLTANDKLLQESYNERSRRGQTFEADLNKYDSKQQEVIKRAVESGILNNTNRTHEFVDMVAKISADKGVSFDFTNNQRLKESGFAMEGKTINGYEDNGNIVLNIESKKALNALVGHEVTHVLEGTDLYTELQSIVKEYATKKGDYQARHDAFSKLYKDVKNANIENEVTADLVGDYLFADTDFVSRLSTEKPNIFKKIYDEIKYLVKSVTGTKEARELEKVKRAFDKAYKESAKASNETKYSLEKTSDGTEYVKAEKNLFVKEDGTMLSEREIFNSLVGKTITLPEGEIKIVNRLPGKDMYNELSKRRPRYEGVEDVKKLNSDVNHNMEELLTNSEAKSLNEPDVNNRHQKQGISSFDTRTVKFYDGDNAYDIEFSIATLNSGEKVAYAKKFFGYDENLTKKIQDSEARSKSPLNQKPVTNNIPQNSENATKYSLTEDNDYISAVENGDMETAQKMVDEVAKNNGYSIKAYHGTGYDFTVFDKAKQGSNYEDWGRLGKGFYFAPDKRSAKMWAERSRGNKTKVMPVYLKGENLLDVYGSLPDDLVDTIPKDWDSLTQRLAQKYSANYIEYMQEFGYDIQEILSSKGYDGLVADDAEYVVFNPEQVKSADTVTYDDKGNVVPLSERFNVSNDDIRYSLSEDEFAPMTETQANERDAMQDGRLQTLAENDMPPEVDAPYTEPGENANPFYDRDIKEVGKRNVKAYMYENPEVKPYFQMEAQVMLNDLRKSIKGERTFNDKLYYDTNGEQGWFATKRQTSEEIAYLLDNFNYTYADLEKGLKAIIEDHGAENNAISKRIEFMIDERLREGYTDFVSGWKIPSDPDYIKLLNDKQITEYSDEAYNRWAGTLAQDHSLGEKPEEIAPVKTGEEKQATPEQATEDIAPFKAEDVEVVDETKPLKGERLSRADARKIENIKSYIEGSRIARETGIKEYDEKIARKQAEYDACKDKTTKKATNLYQQIQNIEAKKTNWLESIDKKIENYHKAIENIEAKSRRDRRVSKNQEYRELFADLIGDTSTWKDKKLGIYYQTNTLRRNLRDIVRDATGKRDIARADAIYEELQGKYNRHEAELNREANAIKKAYRDMKITKAEDAYIQMLGEFRHNPSTTITQDMVDEFYAKHKKHIDMDKVNKAIDMSRKLYDSLYERVNKVLVEHGFKEIEYRKGYFPHFTETKQNLLQKIFNWKTTDETIPTDIAGLTEEFNPNRSWQSFDKRRHSDATDYSFTKGLDNYIRGSLDWIYHIEDIQKRRALETEIRYRHSDKGLQEQIDAIRSNESLTNEEVDELIQNKLKEARNPLGNFLIDLRNGTNNLAGKKSTADRTLEYATNRQIYSTMTNISSRVSANAVVGSVSSALTNFIPITQSWGQVSPMTSVVAMRDTIKSAIKDDGMINKSAFLTNRLRKNEALYKSAWDKVGDKAGAMMEVVDNFTSQTVWRSKYMENIRNGMSENEAIMDADQFAENVIAGRSRGNMPTIFNSKNPVTRVFTAFQLEVANQYGYMFKDMPQDVAKDGLGKLAKGYATMFIGAYAYNALTSTLTGRDSAFDPLAIIEDFLRDLFGDDDDEPKDPLTAVKGLSKDIVEEVPFVGGLMGGGRIPISSAIPYDDPLSMVTGTVDDIAEKDWKNLANEWSNPLYYLAMPMGGGQIRKTVQGLSMFSDEHPISGSYTNSGNLRYPVEDTFLNKLQAGVFGQYANKNARDYFDNNRSALKEKQIEEFIDLDIPIREYWDYREGLKEQDTLEDKFEYIADLDLPVDKKNILINNIVDRKEEVDMSNYDDFSNYDEFDFATKNPEKWDFFQQYGISYDEYRSSKENEDTARMYDWAYQNPEYFQVARAISSDLSVYWKHNGHMWNNIRADKDANGNSIPGSKKDKIIDYINSIDDLEYEEKLVLFKKYYPKDDTYNNEIIDYLNSRDDISYDEMKTILEELEFEVDSEGNIYW